MDKHEKLQAEWNGVDTLVVHLPVEKEKPAELKEVISKPKVEYQPDALDKLVVFVMKKVVKGIRKLERLV